MDESPGTGLPTPVGHYEVLEDNRMPDASVRVFRLREDQDVVRHVHRRSWQMYLVISGTVEIEKDGISERFGPYQTLEIPTGTTHAARSVGGDAILANISVPPLRDDDQHPEQELGEPPDMRLPGPGSDIED